jgi:prepilin-type N-terminal cleavage/methylation domain-containing protein
MKTKGFTLIEVLVAMSIFSIVAVLSSNILVNIIKLEKQSSIQSQVIADANELMLTLKKEIQNSALDYEEYYNMNVLQNPDSAILAGGPYYGINYGIYGSRFFDPGKAGREDFGGQAAQSPQDLGVECSVLGPNGCELFYRFSEDLNNGKNNYSDEFVADAFCDNGVDRDGAGVCDEERNVQDSLFLISKDGQKKTLIGLKKSGESDFGTPEFTLAKLEMNGLDLDQNGIIDTFSCSEEYLCNNDLDQMSDVLLRFPFVKAMDPGERVNFIANTGLRLPQKSDLLNSDLDTSQFVPMTALNLNITSAKFTIKPSEDPWKAFDERNQQFQPSVEIVLTIGLTEQGEKEYPGDFQDFILQSTVSVGATEKISSYPPVEDVLRMEGAGLEESPSWITQILRDARVIF